MEPKRIRFVLGSALIAGLLLLVACGGGSGSSTGSQSSIGSGGSSGGSQSNGTVSLMVSDDSTDDWATIGIKIRSIALLPQGGGTAVTVYTAPTPAPVINLAELDQLGEILGNVQVPTGTYTGATLTIGGNPGDLLLTAGADPTPGFAGSPGTAVPPAQIQIQGVKGSSGSQTVAFNVTFQSPFVVTANGSNALDLEFDLSHPAFLINHTPAASGTSLWAVNFNGPVRHHPIADLAAFVLRHIYGTVSSVATDSSSITIAKVYPVRPTTTPEISVASSQSLTINVDASNGTLFYDLDAKTSANIKSFSTVANTLAGKFVRVATRYQANGTLVAVRMWVSSSFNTVWISPEGHVVHVNTTSNIITVENEDGVGVPVKVDNNTQFFYRTPANSTADATPIATGTAFLASNQLVRGFKVHVTVADPLAVPLVAQTVDIEIAKYDGDISSPNQTSFVDTQTFATVRDNYSVTLKYITNGTQNGKDASGATITGFKWWNLTFPTVLNSGSSAIANFIAATNGSATFGGTAGAIKASGTSFVTWNDPANVNGWAAATTILDPVDIPRGSVATAWSTGSSSGSFGMTVPGGTNTVNIVLSTVSGSATLVYQVDRTNGVVTVSPQDITTTQGLSNVSSSLLVGTPVKVFGVPQADGSIKAYTLFYYTGTTPQ